ncbi:MAG: TetR/AcrR family transcriptional regulator [Bacteroidota bacterium]
MNYKHNKEDVITKGMHLFWAKGYHNLGVDAICRETGMTKGAFYNAFKSKEQFLLTTIENYGNLITAHLQNELANCETKAFDRLLHLYKGMLEAQPENNHIGCLVNNTMSELGILNSTVASATSYQFNKFLNVIEPTVKEAQQNQDLTQTIHSKLLTEIIHTTFFGVLTTSKTTKSSGYTIMETFLYALKNRSDE